MNTLTKERPQAAAPAAEPPVPKTPSEIHVEVKDRPDVGDGIIEVQIQVDDHAKGSSLVITSPRDFAFRKTGS
jgi:hypothetical protein